MGFLTTCQ